MKTEHTTILTPDEPYQIAVNELEESLFITGEEATFLRTMDGIAIN